MGFHDEPEENYEEDGGFPSPSDPMTQQQIEDRNKERYRRYLIDYKGFEEDELDTLFPTFADLEKFYREARIAGGFLDANDKEFDTPGKKTPKDDKTLVVSDTDKRRIDELKKARAAYQKRVKKLHAAIMSGQVSKSSVREELDEANAASGLPPQENLSYEDFMKSIGVDNIDKLLEDMD